MPLASRPHASRYGASGRGRGTLWLVAMGGLEMGAATFGCQSPAVEQGAPPLHSQAASVDPVFRSQPQPPGLPSDVAVLVGAERLRLATLQAVAQAQGVPLAGALQTLVREALWASHAHGDAAVRERLRRAVLARSLLERLRESAVQEGPPQDPEIEAMSRLVWWEVDRPPLRRTLHAVVIVKEASARNEGRRLAALLADALRSERDPAAFERRVDAFKQQHAAHGALQIKVEALPPVSAEGLSVTLDQPSPRVTALDLDYVRPVFALAQVGDQSPLVETRFGFHVILLTEMIAEQRVPWEQRRQRFEPQVLRRRGEERLQSLREQLRQSTEIQVAPSSDALTQLLGPQP